VLAPSKPRRDDVRRYCLDCSKRTGRLVERTCPANNAARKLRELSRQKRAANKASVRAKERKRVKAKRHRTFGGVDVVQFARRAWQHVLKSRHRDARTPHGIPSIRVTGASYPFDDHGSAWIDRHHISMRFGSQTHRAQVECTIVHELCHCAAPEEDAGERRTMHGPRYNTLLCDVAKRIWGKDFDIGPATAGGGYGPSRVIEKKLRERYEER
jgi:hypothetical protein